MRFQTLLIAALTSFFVACHRNEKAAEALRPTPSPAVGSVQQRLAVARSIKLDTTILGIQPGDDLRVAHEKLDKLGQFATPPKQPGETEREGENKILWQLNTTDFRSVLIKTDNNERVTSITAYFREEKMKPFDQIGDTAVAPISSDTQVAWDVVRAARPQLRVVALGKDRKAALIRVFLVQRGRSAALDPD